MKLIFALFFALLVTTSAYSQGTLDAAGVVKSQYKLFEPFVNGASAALTIGEGVCLDIGTAPSDDGIHIDYCVDGYPPVGIIAETSCAVGAKCKVQTKGVFETAVLNVSNGNAVAGNSAYVYTDGSLYGDTTDTNKVPVGLFLDASSASGTIQVFIK
jgi:hypothetical protein